MTRERRGNAAPGRTEGHRIGAAAGHGSTSRGMRMLCVAVGLGGVLLGATGVAAYEAFAEDTSVSVDYEPPKSRAEYLTLWKRELAARGEELPPDVDQMTRQEIMEAWSRLYYEDVVPS